MPLTRRQLTVQLFSELPGVAYDSDSPHVSSPDPQISAILPMLKEGTYTSWSNAVRDTLTSVGLWKYVTGKAICPIDRTTREFDLYEYESVEQLCNTYAHTQKDKQTPQL